MLIGSFFIENENNKMIITYFISKQYWNKDIGTSSIKAIVGYLVKEKGIKEISAEPFEHNIGSKKALEKAGFVYSGKCKDIMKNETILNTSRYVYTCE